MQEVVAYERDAVFAFAHMPGFCAKLGFQEVERSELPLKAWKDCLRCSRFRARDEVATGARPIVQNDGSALLP